MFLIRSRGQGRKKSSISDWIEKHLKGNSLLSYYFFNVIAADRLITRFENLVIPRIEGEISLEPLTTRRQVVI